MRSTYSIKCRRLRKVRLTQFLTLSFILGTNITYKIWMDLPCFLISSEQPQLVTDLCPFLLLNIFLSCLWDNHSINSSYLVNSLSKHSSALWNLNLSQDLKFLTGIFKWMLKETSSLLLLFLFFFSRGMLITFPETSE